MSNNNTVVNKKGKEQTLGVILFLITSCVWGFAFVPQKIAVDLNFGPISLNGLRCLLGAVVLIPVMLIADKVRHKKVTFLGVQGKAEIKKLLFGGLLCGICLTLASTLQQVGLKYSTVGKAGFLSALYIVIVPVITVFFGKKINWNGWLGVALGILGMFFLCFNLKDLASFSINKGDLLLILCSFAFSAHILVIDKFAKNADPLRLAFIQFLICGIICTSIGFIFERNTWNLIPQIAWCIVILGVGSCGVGYTLQMVAQKYVPAYIAPLLMGMECVFSLIAELIFFKKIMSAVEYLGCFLILVAVVIAQLDFSKFGKKKKAAEVATDLQNDGEPNDINNAQINENADNTDENKD